MAITLTPEQQTRLDTFEESAQVAREAGTASKQAAADLAAAELLEEHTTLLALSTHAQALADAQDFIDSMIPPTLPTPAGAAAMAKKP